MTVYVPEAAKQAILSESTQVERRVDILSNSGELMYSSTDTLGIVSGSVSVDMGRDERRSFELVIDDNDGEIRHEPGYLWYDNIVRIYRGVRYTSSYNESVVWLGQIGEFLIDEITTQHFPHSIKIQGRDYTKKLLLSRLRQPTSFAQGQSVANVVRTLAVNGGIPAANMVINGSQNGTSTVLEDVVLFETGVSRWEAIKEICEAYNFEVFFDSYGYFVMQPFKDPYLSPEVVTFQADKDYSNLVSYTKTTRDSRIYNTVLVIGEKANKLPSIGFAQNTQPGSPTNVATLGERTMEPINSALATTDDLAYQMARRHLQVAALEEYDLSIGTIVMPWLEAGNIGAFIDPDDPDGEVFKFLITNFTIPLELGEMSLTAKRVMKVD